jgi:UDP-N-acetylmuramate--alanine ligase
MKKNAKIKLPEPIHFIGIGGVGMSAIAQSLHANGLKVTGSDSSDSTIINRMAELGINIQLSHRASNVESAAAIVHSSAISVDNPELVRAKELGLAIFHRSDVLAKILNCYESVGICGTHGKTTTSALVSHILQKLNCNPTCFVGGAMNAWESTYAHGSGEWAVAEVDESDGSFLKSSHFVTMITNVDVDHMEYFGTREKQLEAFQKFAASTHSDGCCVVNWDDIPLRQVSNMAPRRLAFGFKIGSDVRAIDYKCHEGISSFTAMVERDRFDVTLPLFGRHNVLNALAALATVRALELDVAAAVKALRDFSGVGRRQQRYLQAERLVVLDDYAHNPGKISAYLDSVKENWPTHELVVVFQPHRYSRLRSGLDETIRSFSKCDKLILLPVYAAGEPVDSNFSLDKLTQAFEDGLEKTVVMGAEDFGRAQALLSTVVHDNKKTLMSTVGAGDVWKIAKEFSAKQKSRA